MKLSINTSCIDKPDNKDEFKKICSSFENVEVTNDELSKLVRQGYAFCTQLKNNWKKASNFLCADYLAVDVDEGIRMENMLEHDFVKKYCSFIYTTVNHTDEDHRFRMVFELEETITDPVIMKHAMSGISKKFGGDPSCTDPCRMFFGAKGCEVKHINKTLPAKQVKLLVFHGEESSKPSNYKDTKSSEFTSSIISNNIIDLDMLVVDREGNSHILKELEPNTPIRCPVHTPDDNPSAFTTISKNGTIGVHCMKCKTTYFTSACMPAYDFNYSLSNLNNIEDAAPDFIEEADGTILFPAPKSIVRVNERYLKPSKADGDIVFVRSPKGTGKTYWLEQVVNGCKEENKGRYEWLDGKVDKRFSSDNEFRAWNKWNGVLLIGHRRSLISSLSERLGLKSYINYPYFDHNKNRVIKESFNDPEPYYSICVDSLSTLINTSTNWWPIIIIDEVEQVLTHLTSETVKDRRNNTYQVFKHLINSSKKVYLMDADLNELTVESMYQLLFDKDKSVSVVINDYKEADKSLDVYASEKHLKKVMLDSIKNNERCYITSNSKRKIDVLEELIKQRFGGTKKILSITSENSQEQEIQSFLRNISENIVEYDAILCSPTLGTGIDISFDNNAQNVDCVYGLFEAKVNTHFDIDQQISRVRNPKHTRIWISPQTFRFETSQDVILKEIENSHSKYRQIVNITSDGEKQYNDEEYLKLYANVKSLQRGSKNYLKNNFIKLKEYNGWHINKIEQDDSDLDEIKKLEKLAKQEKQISTVNDLLSAKLITRDEYDTLKYASNHLGLTDQQKSSMRRYEIEAFYLQDINEELIALDNDRKLRYQIREYTLLQTDDLEIEFQELCEEQQSIVYTDRKMLSEKKKLYLNILKKSGLMDNDNNLILDATIQSSGMNEFVEYIKNNKQTIERIFEIVIRNDVNEKPIRQLNEFLKRLGITLHRKTKKRSDGGKNYLYTINQEQIKTIEDIIAKRYVDVADHTETYKKIMSLQNDKFQKFIKPKQSDSKHQTNISISEAWHKNREAIKEHRLFESDNKNIRTNDEDGFYNGPVEDIYTQIQQQIEKQATTSLD
jgi:hypothetical protein